MRVSLHGYGEVLIGFGLVGLVVVFVAHIGRSLLAFLAEVGIPNWALLTLFFSFMIILGVILVILSMAMGEKQHE